jgi:hypothetical protein
VGGVIAPGVALAAGLPAGVAARGAVVAEVAALLVVVAAAVVVVAAALDAAAVVLVVVAVAALLVVAADAGAAVGAAVLPPHAARSAVTPAPPSTRSVSRRESRTVSWWSPDRCAIRCLLGREQNDEHWPPRQAAGRRTLASGAWWRR